MKYIRNHYLPLCSYGTLAFPNSQRNGTVNFTHLANMIQKGFEALFPWYEVHKKPLSSSVLLWNVSFSKFAKAIHLFLSTLRRQLKPAHVANCFSRKQSLFDWKIYSIITIWFPVTQTCRQWWNPWRIPASGRCSSKWPSRIIFTTTRRFGSLRLHRAAF